MTAGNEDANCPEKYRAWPLAPSEPPVRSSEIVSPHCVNCLRWEGEHWYERARCSLLLMHTARLSTCGKFQAMLWVMKKDQPWLKEVLEDAKREFEKHPAWSKPSNIEVRHAGPDGQNKPAAQTGVVLH